jgi:mono/diheme cytochrome c family protein
MRRLAALLCLLVLIVAAGLAQQTQEKKESAPAQAPGNLVIPPEEAKRENPIKPTAASIADGKKLFGYQCTMCHGEKGDGKGDLVESMKLTMRDYTDPATLKELTDGSLFYILEKGKGKMPGQEGRMKAEQKWNLVNYIRSLSIKTAETKPPAPPKPE